MTKYEQYNKFCVDHMDNNADSFFNALQKEFHTSFGATLNIWYATQRNWFEPEMIDEFIHLATVSGENEFQPNIFSGDFDWDYENKKFVPENGQKMKKMEVLIEEIEKSHNVNV